MVMKYVRIGIIEWVEKFKEVKGSYYDYVAEIYSTSKLKEDMIRGELKSKGWREIETNNDIAVFEKDRHVIRIFKLWL